MPSQARSDAFAHISSILSWSPSSDPARPGSTGSCRQLAQFAYMRAVCHQMLAQSTHPTWRPEEVPAVAKAIHGRPGTQRRSCVSHTVCTPSCCTYTAATACCQLDGNAVVPPQPPYCCSHRLVVSSCVLQPAAPTPGATLLPAHGCTAQGKDLTYTTPNLLRSTHPAAAHLWSRLLNTRHKALHHAGVGCPLHIRPSAHYHSAACPGVGGCCQGLLLGRPSPAAAHALRGPPAALASGTRPLYPAREVMYWYSARCMAGSLGGRVCLGTAHWAHLTAPTCSVPGCWSMLGARRRQLQRRGGQPRPALGLAAPLLLLLLLL